MRAILCLSTNTKRCTLLSTVLQAYPLVSVTPASSIEAVISALESHHYDSLFIDLAHVFPHTKEFIEFVRSNLPNTFIFMLRSEKFTIESRQLLPLSDGSFSFPRNHKDLAHIFSKLEKLFPQKHSEEPEIHREEEKENPTAERILSLLEEFEEFEPSLERLTIEIAQDKELSRLILNRINSPFYGLPTRINSVDRSVRLLGVRGVLTLLNETVQTWMEKAA